MNYFSDYVLLDIFEALDDSSLVAASQVCQKWLQLITKSKSIMKRFTLSLVVATDRSFGVFGKIFNGNYQNIVIRNSLKYDALLPEYFEYLAKHETTVNNITLQDFMFNHLISTIYIFDLENITNLTLMNCNLDTDQVTPIEMPNLANLELLNSTEFLKFVKIHQVKVLKISNHGHYERGLKPIITELLNSFLLTCDNLKAFTLSNFNNHSTPLTFKIDEFKFNLFSLTVEGSIINNLKLFIVSQKYSLRNLAVHSEDQDVELLKTIFYDLTLRELEIDVENVPQYFPSIIRNPTIKKLILRKNSILLSSRTAMIRNRFFNAVRGVDDIGAMPRVRVRPPNLYHQNRYLALPVFEEFDMGAGRPNFDYLPPQVNQEQQLALRELELRRLQQIIEDRNRAAPSSISSFQKAEKILSICSSVEEISVYDFELTKDDFLTSIHFAMPNLKVLKLSTVPHVIPPIVQLDNLIHLEIDKIDTELNLHNLIFLVIYSPNLKSIKINKIIAEIFTEKFFTTIINKAKKLEEFHIGSDCYFTNELNESVRHMKSMGRPLKKLTLIKNSCKMRGDYDANNMYMQDFKFSLCGDDQMFFTSMINKFKLGGMERDMNDIVTKLDDSRRYILAEIG